MQRKALLLTLSLAAFAPTARAQTAECRAFSSVYSVAGIPYEHLTSELRRDFRVVSGSALTGVSQTAFIRAAGLAAGSWNEQSGGRALRYAGVAPTMDLQQAIEQCPPNYTSLIQVFPGKEPEGQDAAADIVPMCVERFNNNTFGRAHAFLIRVFTTAKDGTAFNWTSAGSTIGATQTDLVGVLMHEFGHSFNVTHTTNVDNNDQVTEGQYSIMGYAYTASTRQRELYWRDLRCTRTLVSSSTAYRRTITNGAISGEAQFLAGGLDNGWAKISAGATFTSTNGIVDWSHAAERPDCTVWGKSVPPSVQNCVEQSNDLHVFTEAVFRERSIASRVIGSDPNEVVAEVSSNGSQFAVHQVNMRRSTDNFVTDSFTKLRVCNGMTGFMQCSASTAIVVNSALPLAVAYHEGLAQTVVAWVNQNRQNDTSSHAVKIAVGSISDTLLPVPEDLTDSTGNRVQSNVTPGLACSTRAANGFDCIAAVVRQDDALGTITLYRFSVARNNQRNKYAITMDPNSTAVQVGGTSARTGNRIAAWFQSGKFYLGFRTLNDNQPLHVWSSADTLTWAANNFGGTVDAGPSAISYWTGDNQLLYVH
jgi:hypothetical protein